MSEPRVLEIGGCVRDDLLGVPHKDYDFIVEVESFERLKEYVLEIGCEIFEERPWALTIRCRVPRVTSPRWAKYAGQAIDVVAPRLDGPYSDGRRPEFVEVGNLRTDFARRDFTVNAIGRDIDTGEIHDYHGGLADLRAMNLRCVGQPIDRFTEDGLRAIRALRFHIVKGFDYDISLQLALFSDWLAPILANQEPNRIREELVRCFHHNTMRTLDALYVLSDKSIEALFHGGLWLEPTLSK